VTPAALERQLDTLTQRGYRGARFSEALAGSEGGRVACVTFDDGYRSVLELAKPILDRHGYPGTLFVPTDWPGAGRPMRWPGIDRWIGTPHERELEALGWRELRELADAGWEIGSHTCSHPRLPQLDAGALARELRDSRARIEQELERSCVSLAYPYGDVDARVTAAAQAAGYEWACTIPRVISSPTPLLWPRVPIYFGDDQRRFAAKVSAPLRRLRASAPGRWFDRARVAAVERRRQA
jgi:peptidoglycan/xylan/chitin deacetylase (PgdA/CDA1 family)